MFVLVICQVEFIIIWRNKTSDGLNHEKMDDFRILSLFWPIFSINLPLNGWKFGNLSVNIQYMIVHDWKTIYIRIFGFIDLVTVNWAILTPFSQVGVKKGPKNGGWAHFFDYRNSDPSFGTFELSESAENHFSATFP